MKKAVIFGAGGFIGSHLVKAMIAEQSYFPVCIDRTSDKLQLIAGGSGFEFHELDISTQSEKQEELVKDADLVIDLIAYANPHLYLKIPLEVVELNLFENLKIADLCEKHKKRLIQFSTSEIYGMSDGTEVPFNEDETNLILGPVKNQRWIYSCAKQLLERMLYAKGQKGKLDYTIIRPFNFVGPEMDFLVREDSKDIPRVFPGFMSALLFNHPLKVVDGGKHFRTWTYIDDAIDAVMRIVNAPEQCKNDTINIGTKGNEISVSAMASMMVEMYEQITGKNSVSLLEEVDGLEFYGEGYEDCDRRIPDDRKMKRLGWDPQYNLEETFRTTMEYYIQTYATEQQASASS